MAQRAIVRTIPAPVGGLNDINSIADMPPTDALVMDNIFPGTNSCSLRGGSVQWVSGLGAIGETLLAYNGINSKKLFVAAGTSIIDVTSSGAAGAAVLGGFSNARWDYVNFGGNAGNHLVAVNSADLPIYYNGSTWAVSGSGFATAITGVDARLFSSVAMFKNRLYFVEKNSLKCWYLGTNSIGGEANVLDFSGVARLGGKLVAITTIPTSAGSSLDDYFCAITSEGELLVYAGTDPASVSTFALVGVYRVGRPVANGTAIDGSRFIEKMGSDMIAITVDGFTTLQSALNNDVVAQSTTINKKIVNSVTRDTGQYKQNFGWQIVLAPNNNKLLINVPTGGGEYYQYVMNTITGAWCRFTGLNAYCWTYWDDNLWAVMGPSTGSGSGGSGVSGSGSTIYKMDVTGIATDSAPIAFPTGPWVLTQDFNTGITENIYYMVAPYGDESTNTVHLYRIDPTWGTGTTSNVYHYTYNGNGLSGFTLASTFSINTLTTRPFYSAGLCLGQSDSNVVFIPHQAGNGGCIRVDSNGNTLALYATAASPSGVWAASCAVTYGRYIFFSCAEQSTRAIFNVYDTTTSITTNIVLPALSKITACNEIIINNGFIYHISGGYTAKYDLLTYSLISVGLSISYFPDLVGKVKSSGNKLWYNGSDAVTPPYTPDLKSINNEGDTQIVEIINYNFTPSSDFYPYELHIMNNYMMVEFLCNGQPTNHHIRTWVRT